jgi:hypothetical protein
VTREASGTRSVSGAPPAHRAGHVARRDHHRQHELPRAIGIAGDAVVAEHDLDRALRGDRGDGLREHIRALLIEHRRGDSRAHRRLVTALRIIALLDRRLDRARAGLDRHRADRGIDRQREDVGGLDRALAAVLELLRDHGLDDRAAHGDLDLAVEHRQRRRAAGRPTRHGRVHPHRAPRAARVRHPGRHDQGECEGCEQAHHAV